jgi:hypothetical protein
MNKWKTSKEQWWNDTNRGKPKCSGGTLSQCHFVHHKSHINMLGIEPRPNLLAIILLFFFIHHKSGMKFPGVEPGSPSAVIVLLFLVYWATLAPIIASVTGWLAHDLQGMWKGAVATIYKERHKKTTENDRIIVLWEKFRMWDHDSDVRHYLLMCHFTQSAAHCISEIN